MSVFDQSLPTPQNPEDMEAATFRPSFGERFSGAWQEETVRTDAWAYSSRKKRAIGDEVYGNLPEEDRARVDAWSRSNPGDVDGRTRLIADLSGQARDRDPDGWGDLPAGHDGFDEELQRQRLADYDEAQALMGPSPGFAGFLGGLARAMTDETSLAMLPLGGPARSAGKFILTEAFLGGVGEAMVLPREHRVAGELDLAPPEDAKRIAMGVAGGAALSGALTAVQRGWRYARDLNTPHVEGKPGEAGTAVHDARVRKAEEDIRKGATPEPETEAVEDATARDLPPGFPEQPVPRDWPRIRNGIFAGESGGDYNALYGYQNREGGEFADVRITEMTVDQAIAFSSPSGRYGQWVKGQIGRVATPMGAYQVVGRTLRAAKQAMGLRGDELMTEAVQDQIGLWILRTQGTGAWEGYRGPQRTRPVPGDDVPQFGGYTTRGYTAGNQVSAGDFRIDVEYEVVDASLLQRASGDLQPRQRSRAQSDEQVAEIAARLDPARLLPAPEADRGAPVVGPDNVIESGNGRFMAIERAAARHPDRIDAYRKAIEAAGFEIPADVETPVLIARRRTDLEPADRRRFVVAANDNATARMSATERAMARADDLGSDALALYDPGQPLGARANRAFVKRALAAFPQTERNALADASGALNAEGVRTLKELMFARAYGASDILARYAETDAGPLRSLMEALEQAAPAWAALRGEIAAGTVRAEFDITDHLLDAMRLIALARETAAREGGQVARLIDELMGDVDLLDGAVPPLTRALVGKMWRGDRAAPAPEIAGFLARYADEARKVGRADAGLFDAPGPADVLRALDPEHFGELTDLGVARSAMRAPAAEPGPEIPETAFRDGASSPEAEAGNRIAESDLEDFGDIEFETPDGTKLTLRDYLDDLEADENLVDVIDACTLGRAA